MGRDARSSRVELGHLMGDDKFDHLELHGDESALPAELKVDLRQTSFERIEIGPLADGPPHSYAIRLDDRRFFCSTQDDLPPYYESLFDYLSQHGVTVRLKDFLRELEREVVVLERLSPGDHAEAPASAPPQAAAPKGFDVESWTPEQGEPTQGQLDSIPATKMMWIARALGVALATAFAAYQIYYQMFLESPEARADRVDRERRRARYGVYLDQSKQKAADDAQRQVIHDFH